MWGIDFDGVTGQPIQGPLANFWAYDEKFVGGMSVAVGDIDGDGQADVVTGAGEGGGPHIRVFSGSTGEELSSFFGYEAEFRGGVRVALGVAVQPDFIGFSGGDANLHRWEGNSTINALDPMGTEPYSSKTGPYVSPWQQVINDAINGTAGVPKLLPHYSQNPPSNGLTLGPGAESVELRRIWICDTSKIETWLSLQWHSTGVTAYAWLPWFIAPETCHTARISLNSPDPLGR